MKLAASFLLAFPFLSDVVVGQQEELYLGVYNATDPNDDNDDFALCGSYLWGCLAIPSHSRGCNSGVEFGTLEEIGTDHQQWIYEDGLLKTKLAYKSYMFSSSQQRCLGPRVKELTPDTTTSSYELVLQTCPENEQDARHMRFVLVDDRVQSLAPVVVSQTNNMEGDDLPATTPYCMTIDGSVVMASAGSKIRLEPCNEDSYALQQSWKAYGTRLPFLYPLQPVWGLEDVVELAYDVGTTTDRDDAASVVVDIYRKEEDAPVYSFETSTPSGILSLNVSYLVGENNEAGEYVVKFQIGEDMDYSVSFSVAEEAHVESCGTTSSNLSTSSNLAIALALSAAGVLLFFIVCYHYFFATAGENAAVQKADELPAKPSAEEKDDDALETGSQTTASNDSVLDSVCSD